MTNGVTSTYQYDHDGRRTQATIGGDTTNYLWDITSPYGDVIAEYDNSTPTPQLEATYMLANGQLLSQTRGANTHYYLSDGQHNVRALMDENGIVTDTYDYDAFGELRASSSTPTDNAYRFAGQQFDPATGLYSMRARYYDPSHGRFLSRDTYAYNYQNPIELNRYAYAKNSPTNGYDPTGHFFVETGINYRFSVKQATALKLLAQIKNLALVVPVKEAIVAMLLIGLPFIQVLLQPDILPYFPPNTSQPPVVPQTYPYTGPQPGTVPTPPGGPQTGPYTGPQPTVTPPGTSPYNQVPPQTNPDTYTFPDPSLQPEPQPAPTPPQDPEQPKCNPKTDPKCDKEVFDMALGPGETLIEFANSFTDRPTLFWKEWPDFMMKNNKGNWLEWTKRYAYASFKIAINLWQNKHPNGKIKFNLEGINSSKIITLQELRYILKNPVFISKTTFYAFPPLRQLSAEEANTRIASIRPLLDNLPRE